MTGRHDAPGESCAFLQVRSARPRITGSLPRDPHSTALIRRIFFPSKPTRRQKRTLLTRVAPILLPAERRKL